MIAFSQLKGDLTPPKTYAHIAGVEIGARFGGRGEVAILGIHTQMMRGIDSTWVPSTSAFHHSAFCHNALRVFSVCIML